MGSRDIRECVWARNNNRQSHAREEAVVLGREGKRWEK